MDGRSVPHWAGIVHADLHAMVIGKGKIVQRDERLPQRDRGDPAVERAKAPVAAGTYVDDHGAVRQPGVVPAAHVVHLDLRDVLLQIPKQIGDILRAVQAQRASGVEKQVCGILGKHSFHLQEQDTTIFPNFLLKNGHSIWKSRIR